MLHKLYIIMFLISSCLVSFNSFANEVKIEVNPQKPVAGEVFQAYFRIFTTDGDDPQVNFSPFNLEVVGKSNQGVSTRTVYANGKLTVSRELTVVYELVSSRPGPAAMRDININVGGTIIKHPTVNLTVLKERQEPSEVFVMADVPKKTLFLGEGIVVRYYLYSKVPVSNLDIKKYPKLNSFLKRFIQEAERTERVSVDGQLYMRTQIYAAKLYPEKTGELKIDPLHLSATYPSSRMGDPFGAFGLNRDFKTRTVSSEMIKIDVKALPPAPAHFTGLVGQHDIQLQIGQSKLIVNEPLEIKLTVSGVGALENFEAPEILKHPGLEEFESNGDLKISDADQATKVFDYTFLAKENLKLPARTLTLSYFDPNSERFVPTELQIPEIVVAGGQATNEKPASPKNEVETKTEPVINLKKPELSGLATSVESSWKTWMPVINMVLGGLAILLVIGWMVKTNGFNLPKPQHNVPTSFKKGKFELREFVQWMSPLIHKTGRSPISIIKDSSLSDESKRYFIDLLSSNDYKDYSAKKGELNFKYSAGPFRELGRYIETVKNDSSSQPS